MVLPNGFVLKKEFFNLDETRVYLIDPDGKEVVPPRVEEILWCDEIVYGNRSWLTPSGTHFCSFIYDGKTRRHTEFFDTGEPCHAPDQKGTLSQHSIWSGRE